MSAHKFQEGNTMHHAGSTLWVLCAFLLGAPVHAADEPRLLRDIADRVDPAALHSTIATLVGFGTRHTLSETRSQTRGIGAARRWVQARFVALGRECGGCLDVVTPSQVVTGRDIPQPTEVMDGVAIQRGSSEPNRVGM